MRLANSLLCATRGEHLVDASSASSAYSMDRAEAGSASIRGRWQVVGARAIIDEDTLCHEFELHTSGI